MPRTRSPRRIEIDGAVERAADEDGAVGGSVEPKGARATFRSPRARPNVAALAVELRHVCAEVAAGRRVLVCAGTRIEIDGRRERAGDEDRAVGRGGDPSDGVVAKAGRRPAPRVGPEVGAIAGELHDECVDAVRASLVDAGSGIEIDCALKLADDDHRSVGGDGEPSHDLGSGAAPGARPTIEACVGGARVARARAVAAPVRVASRRVHSARTVLHDGGVESSADRAVRVVATEVDEIEIAARAACEQGDADDCRRRAESSGSCADSSFRHSSPSRPSDTKTPMPSPMRPTKE